VALRTIKSSKQNCVLQRHAEALGDRGGRLYGSRKIGILNIEVHAAAGEVFVEDYGQSVTRGDGSEQATRIAAVVNVMAPVDGLNGKRVAAGDDLRRARGAHRSRPQRVAYAL